MAKTFGTFIRERASALGLTTQRDLQRILARNGCEVSDVSISKWYRDEARPRHWRLRVLCDALGLHGDARQAAFDLAADRPGDSSEAA